jgi:hypothetical protein
MQWVKKVLLQLHIHVSSAVQRAQIDLRTTTKASRATIATGVMKFTATNAGLLKDRIVGAH